MVQQSLFADFPTTLRRFLVAAVAFGVLLLLANRIAVVLTPPPLAIAMPSYDLSTSSRIITIEGQTEPGASLTINGRTFAPDATGAFSTDVILRPGTNTIEVEARRWHSRPARVERRIHVHQDSAPLA